MISTLRDALFLARHDLRHLFRAKETWLWTFLMPIAFFYFIGTVTGGSRSQAPTAEPIALRAPAGAGWLASRFARELEQMNYRVAPGRSRVLSLPADFTGAMIEGRPVVLAFTRLGDRDAARYDEARIRRAAFALAADLAVLRIGGGAVTPERLAALDAEPRPLTLKVETAGARVEPPRGFQQSVPGTMVMFTLLVLFTSGAVTLTIERNQGLLRRLAAAPVSRGGVVLGKWLARLALGLVQIAFAMAAGSLLFGVQWGPHLGAIAAVLAAYAALATSLGMLLANFTRTEAQTIAIGVLASNLFGALGGCWWPIEITPAWAQKLALLLPTGWAMDALHQLVIFGAGPAAALPHIAVLTAAALAAGWLTARRFRFE